MSEVELDRWSDVAEQIRSVWKDLEAIHAWAREREGSSEKTEEIIKLRPPWLRGEGDRCVVLDRYRRDQHPQARVLTGSAPDLPKLDTEAQVSLVLHALKTEIEELALADEGKRHNVRIACYGPGGIYMGSRTCHARANTSSLLRQRPDPSPPLELRDVEDAIVARMAATMRVGNEGNKAIAANYQALFSDVSSAYKGLFAMVLDHMRSLDATARTKHAHVESLLEKAIEAKRAELQTLDTPQQPAAATAADLQLKREALTKVTGIGERVLGALLGDRLGLPPEVVSLLHTLQEDPEVQAALQSPGFANSIRDPEVMTVFRSVLTSMAGQGHDVPPTPGAASPPPAPEPPPAT